MTGPNKAPLSRAEMALAEVKDATRELNAAIGEAREVRRLLLDTVAEVHRSAANWRHTYELSLKQEYANGVEEYATHLKSVMDDHARAVTNRLDKLICAVTSSLHTPRGRMSLEQFLTSEPITLDGPPKMTSKSPRRKRR
jgi:hypothetical protein